MADIEFTHHFGDLPEYGIQSRDITREGRDGHRFKLTGRRGVRTQISIYALLVDDAAWSAYDAGVKACQGQIKTIKNTTEDWTPLQVMVHRVTPMDRKPRVVVVAGSASTNTRLWRGSLEITVLGVTT